MDDQLKQCVWQVSSCLVGIAECRQCRLYIRFRGGRKHARLTYLGHVGGHKARLHTLYNNALLSILRLQIIAQLVDECLGITGNKCVRNIITSYFPSFHLPWWHCRHLTGDSV